MKTAHRTRFRMLAAVAIPAGLLALLAAATFLPGLHVSPDFAATALGGLIIYTFGALALVDRRRLRIGAVRFERAEVDEEVVALPLPARRRLPVTRSAGERLAA